MTGRERRGARIAAGFLLILRCAACAPNTTRPAADSGETRANEAAWSPASADLVFMSNRDGNGEVYLLRAGETEWVNLTHEPAGDNWPEWSPGGSRIAFQSRRSGNLDIWAMNADGSDPIQLTDDPAHDYLPSWSPDGTRITFTSWRQEPGDAGEANHIYIMNADGSDERRLIAESPGISSGAPWSPDGRSVVLTRKRDEKGSDLFLMDVETRHERRLTDDEAFDGSPAFSPDGSRIAFYSDDGSSSELVIINADGSDRRTILGGGQSWYPRWSPDGRWLVYTAAVPAGQEENLDVLTIEVSGGEPMPLAVGPGREAEGRWRRSKASAAGG